MIDRFKRLGQNRLLIFLISLVMILVIGISDYLTGYEISFSLFYLIPISIVTWLTTRELGILASIISAITWLMADVATGHRYSQLIILFWNSGIRFGFFIVATVLLTELRKALDRLQILSRTDTLTGAANTRYFYELAQHELNRSKRYQHPFTLVYIDLDNFKTVNDTLGHHTGDRVLCVVVESIQQGLRKTDIVGRLGGDEFAILLPETSKDSAQAAVSRIHENMLSAMKVNHWPVTFSVGVLTCSKPNYSVDDVVKIADHLMYTIKNNGKNGVIYLEENESSPLASK